MSMDIFQYLNYRLIDDDRTREITSNDPQFLSVDEDHNLIHKVGIHKATILGHSDEDYKIHYEDYEQDHEEEHDKEHDENHNHYDDHEEHNEDHNHDEHDEQRLYFKLKRQGFPDFVSAFFPN